MPPAVLAAVLPAAITGGAVVAGSLVQRGANNRAAEASERASQDAIALERERLAAEQAQWEAEQARRAPYRQASDALLRDYARQHGIALDPMPRMTQPGARPVGAPPRTAQPQPQQTLGTIARRSPAAVQTAPLQAPGRRLTLGMLAQRRMA